MWHFSNYSEPEFVEYLPEQIRDAVTDDDLEWVAVKYNSDRFQKVLARHIAINHKLHDYSGWGCQKYVGSGSI
jgi:hypothetical protein